MNEQQTSRLNALFAPYTQPGRPGVVVGIAQHGKTLYREAFGLANVEHRVAMTPTTRVAICSVTKHITCASVLQLASEGRLDIDAPIGRWIPELAHAAQAPTLRQLMNHTGGSRCQLDVGAFNGVTPHPAGTPMRMLQRQRQLNFEPGDGQMYSNGGYVLLSMAIERATGMPFGRYVEQALFAPLRLDASTAPSRWWPLPQGAATFYMPHEGGVWRHGIGFEEETLGGGCVISSVDDMLRWAAHLRCSRGPVSLDSLTATKQGHDDFLHGIYRFGLTDSRWRDQRLVEHSGGAVGASCHLLIAPEAELELFVFFNSMEPAQSLARQAAAIVLEDRLAPEPAMPAPRAERYPDLLGQYIDEEQGLTIGFGELPDGGLGVSILGGAFVPALQGHAPSRDELPFHVPTAVGPRYFRREPIQGALQWLEAGRWRTLRMMTSSMPTAQAMASALGDATYVSDEAGAKLQFRLEGEKLKLRSWGEFGVWDFPLQTLASDLLSFGFYEGSPSWLARLHAKGGRVESIDMNSTRTRGLRFERQS